MTTPLNLCVKGVLTELIPLLGWKMVLRSVALQVSIVRRDEIGNNKKVWPGLVFDDEILANPD